MFQSTLVTEFDSSVTKIGSFTAMIMLGYAVGALLSGFVIPKYGVRWPMMACGLVSSGGFGLVGLLIRVYKSVFLVALVHFLFIGIPFGLGVSVSVVAAKYHVSRERQGFVQCVMTAGVSTAGLVLPWLYRKWWDRPKMNE